ncbi:trypsin-like serine protease [Photobacterium toruni]|uniref:trypsin-like serine protease n=1 Tax=Photobacterium toruni TaxID=1935446 RepID=UPI0021CA6B99|nr:trypsin-like serine protease [Photobacterium toruni]
MRLYIQKNTIRYLLLFLLIITSSHHSAVLATESTSKAINSNPATLYAPLLLPWQAAITSSNITAVLCGAVVIDEYWLITAAHCTKNYIRHIIAGTSSVPQRNTQQLGDKYKFTITHIINNPHYNKEIFANDIALIRVNRSLFTVAKPIIIASVNEQITANNIFDNSWVIHQNSKANLIASGWGKSNNNTNINYPNQLQLVTLAGVPDQYCNNSWVIHQNSKANLIASGWGKSNNNTNINYPNQLQLVTLAGVPDQYCNGLQANKSLIICADSNIDGLIKDVCSGDSGGPLIWQNPQHVADSDFGLRVVGIVSNGALCEHRLRNPTQQYQQLHGQYTELASLRTWIENSIKQYDNLPHFSLATHYNSPNYNNDPFDIADDYPQNQDLNLLLVSTQPQTAGNIPLTVLAILITIALSRRRINL